MASTAPKATLPPWLVASQSVSHISQVLKTLQNRELSRERARHASRRQSQAEQQGSSLKSQARHRFRLPIVQSKASHVEQYAVAVGSLDENNYKNRYYQLEPYDRTRVIVGQGKGKEGKVGGGNAAEQEGRYLNASWVQERLGQKWWIAAQAPLPHTAHAFLSVLMQNSFDPPLGSGSTAKSSRVRTVVQLTQNVESGRTKAHAYFPSDVGKSLLVPAERGCSLPALKVTLLETHMVEEAHCLRSTVAVVPVDRPPANVAEGCQELEVNRGEEGEYGEESRERVVFQHLLYASWPDHGVPEAKHRVSLLKFLKLVDETNRDREFTAKMTGEKAAVLDPDPPILVGCSAGIGRTGSFIAISSLMRGLGFLKPAPITPKKLAESPLGPLPEDLQGDWIVQEIDSLREQRPGMVQREEQMLLVYEILMDAYEGAAHD